CTNTGPTCDKYGPCDEYSGSNAKCFCKCAGNDEWSQNVRCCLRYLFDTGIPFLNMNFPSRLAHWICYGLMTFTPENPNPIPSNEMAECYHKCAQEQKKKCDRC